MQPCKIEYTWQSFFKAHYYDNHYVQPVDLNEATKKTILDKPKYQGVARQAQQLLAPVDVQKALATPFTIDESANRVRGQAFAAHGFKPLSGNVIGTGEVVGNVIEHSKLSGWLIKGCGGRYDETTKEMGDAAVLPSAHGETNIMSTYESMLRVPMRKHLKDHAKKNGLMGRKDGGFNFVLPKERYLPIPNANPKGTFGSRFCILSQKLDILSQEETAAAIQAMSVRDQQDLAQSMSKAVQGGYTDAHFGNIRLIRGTKNWTTIDVEPMGAMVAKQDPRFSEPDSIEKCARVGMAKLSLHATEVGGTFARVVNQEYEKVLKPKLSYWKIALSLTIIYPIVILVHSIWQRIKLKPVIDEVVKCQQEIQQKMKILVSRNQHLFASSGLSMLNPSKDQTMKMLENIQKLFMEDPQGKILVKKSNEINRKFNEITNGVLGEKVPVQFDISQLMGGGLAGAF